MIEFIFLLFFGVLYAEVQCRKNDDVPAIAAWRAITFFGMVVALILLTLAVTDALDS